MLPVPMEDPRRLPDEESVLEDERVAEESVREVPRDSVPEDPEILRPEVPLSRSAPRLDVEPESR